MTYQLLTAFDFAATADYSAGRPELGRLVTVRKWLNGANGEILRRAAIGARTASGNA